MSARVPYLSTFCALSIAWLSACSGGDAATCLDDRSCDTGQRCVQASFGEPGTCQPCASTETPYDGTDDDCSPRTPDSDLDGDGDNWDRAPNKPGKDCDDQDRLVGFGRSEVCGDAKDNDCDAVIDEADCADQLPPMVAIVAPADNDVIVGPLAIQVELSDDVGIVRLEITLNGTPLGGETYATPVALRSFSLNVDSSTLVDGGGILEAKVTDVKGQTTSATVRIVIDNQTGPALTVLRPQPAAAYGGNMDVQVDVTDPRGVVEVTLAVDGVDAYTSTAGGGLHSLLLDTFAMSEGPHLVSFRAVDSGGSASSSDIAFVVDNTAPVVTVIRPQPNDRLAMLADVEVVATDATAVASISFGGLVSSGPSLLGQLDTLTIPNGPVTFVASAVDSAEVSGGGGNVASVNIDVVIDNGALGGPTGAFVKPLDNDAVIGRSVVEFNPVVLSGRTVASVGLYVNGALVEVDSGSPYTFQVDFGRFTGPTTLRAEVLDNTGAIGSVAITVTASGDLPFVGATVVPVPLLLYGGYTVADLNADGVKDIVAAASPIRAYFGIRDVAGRWRVGRTYTFNGLIGQTEFAARETSGGAIIYSLGSSLNVIAYNEAMGPPQIFNYAIHPQGTQVAIRLADLNGDGLDDVVVGSTLGLSILLTQSDGSLTLQPALPASPQVSDVVVSDLDNDGDLDILVGRSSGAQNGSISTYFNTGSGGFGASSDLVVGQAERVAVGDTTGDGYPDIIIQLSQSDVFSVLVGQPASPATYTPGQAMNGLSIGGRGVLTHDFDGDGLLDILAVQAPSNGFEIWRNVAGTFERTRAYLATVNASRPMLVDMDGGGTLDLVLAGSFNSEIAVVQGEGGTDFYAPEVRLEVAPVDNFVAGGLGGGRDRIYVGQMGTGAVYDRTPQGYVVNTAGLPSSIATTADLNGDGRQDLLLSGMAALDNGATYDLQAFGPSPLAAGDVDGDGLLDIIARDGIYSYPASVFTMLAIGTTSNRMLGDFDDNGVLDIAALQQGGSVAVLRYNQVLGMFTRLTYTAPSLAVSAAAGDVTGDGVDDLVMGHANGVQVLPGDPSVGFGQPIQFSLGMTVVAVSVAVADLTADGLNDIVGLTNTRNVFVIPQKAAGGHLPPVLLSAHDPATLEVIDLEGDGDPDVLMRSGAAVPRLVEFLNRPLR